MYVAELPTLIKAIWLKGSPLTYVAKKLMSLVVLTKQRIQMNWVAVMFNNLYIQLQDLFTSTKPKASRENIKLGVAQIVDIMFWIWFLVDMTFIVPNFEKEDESVAKVPLKTQAIGGTKILGVHFRLTLIDLDKEINDIEEVDGMNTQLETSQQPKIPPTLMSVCNLGIWGNFILEIPYYHRESAHQQIDHRTHPLQRKKQDMKFQSCSAYTSPPLKSPL
jgi:hypothetical protein